MSYTIAVKPSQTPGKVTATSSDNHVTITSTPLLDGAAYWLNAGAPSSASIVTVWSSGSSHWALYQRTHEAKRGPVTIFYRARQIAAAQPLRCKT
jgi:hypothetical protein